MASDAFDGYLTDRKAGKEALLICDTWEMADALNRRLHDTFTADGPAARAARDQEISVGDLIVSRRNDATLVLRRRAGQTRAAERPTDHARVIVERDYLKENVTLGYAVTVHSAQGVTTDTAHAVVVEGATRSMAYVAMSRGRDTNQAYIYTRDDREADHDHGDPVAPDQVHQLRRGTEYSAAHHLRSITANDDRPRSMHVEAQQADRELLPDIIGRVLEGNDQRQLSRQVAWRNQTTHAKHWRANYERTAASIPSAGRSRDIGGLEL
jgi:hypothetical protein